jgi:endopeptidase La
VDNYLDYQVDLSNVLFICSANITDTISGPLLDRMDVIQLSSYTNEEKRQIYNLHLLPRAINDSGLTKEHKFTIKPEVVDVLVNEYAREAGVRSLDKYIRKILEKIAFQIVQKGPEQEVVIEPTALVKYIGHPKFSKSRFYQQTPPGVVIGLAYTEYGGSLIYLEATQSTFHPPPTSDKPTKTTGAIKFTGSLGNVMKESMQIAYSYAKTYAHENLKSDYFEKHEVHVHAPEGATPKDGPSAGVTITTALLSLAMNKPIKENLGMTGEISFRGKVLKIGGVKEKILAAKREGLKELIFPKSNKENIDELKPYIKEGLIIHYVDVYEDVFKIAFESK